MDHLLSIFIISFIKDLHSPTGEDGIQGDVDSRPAESRALNRYQILNI
jgi:hypothetical protein